MVMFLISRLLSFSTGFSSPMSMHILCGIQGKFPEGQEIAIKRLSRALGQGLYEFKNEVVLC